MADQSPHLQIMRKGSSPRAPRCASSRTRPFEVAFRGSPDASATPAAARRRDAPRASPDLTTRDTHMSSGVRFAGDERRRALHQTVTPLSNSRVQEIRRIASPYRPEGAPEVRPCKVHRHGAGASRASVPGAPVHREGESEESGMEKRGSEAGTGHRQGATRVEGRGAARGERVERARGARREGLGAREKPESPCVVSRGGEGDDRPLRGRAARRPDLRRRGRHRGRRAIRGRSQDQDPRRGQGGIRARDRSRIGARNRRRSGGLCIQRPRGGPHARHQDDPDPRTPMGPRRRQQPCRSTVSFERSFEHDHGVRRGTGTGEDPTRCIRRSHASPIAGAFLR